MDTELIVWISSADAPTICAHSLNAMTIISRVTVSVRPRLMLFFSTSVFLLPAIFVKTGITKLDTSIVATIHMAMVTAAVNHGLLSGASRVLGKTPKNLLYASPE